MRSYIADSANDVWKQAVTELLHDKDTLSVDSRNGPTREFLHAALTIRDPRNRWVVGRIPPLNPAFALAEVVWIMTGRNDTSFLSHWFPKYPQFVGYQPLQHGAYGKRLRHHFGYDQLRQAASALRNQPNSRQVVLQIWSCQDDLPLDDGVPRSPDIPCNLLSCIKTRNGRLEWMQVIRSNDVDRGVPHNIIQFTMLQELMAGWLGLELGSYVQISDSFHWYEKQSARLRIDYDVVPEQNTDHFRFSIDTCLQAFDVLADRMDQIIQSRKAGATPALPEPVLPQSFEHMFLIIAADDARRFGDISLANSLAASCKNPLLLQMWNRWMQSTTINSSIKSMPLREGLSL